MGEMTGSEVAFLAVMLAIGSYAAGWLHGWSGRSDAFLKGLDVGRRIWKPNAHQPDAGKGGA
jgi:hypothetical protein